MNGILLVAIDDLRSSSQDGASDAHLLLGFLFEHGLGVTTDLEVGVEHYKISAEAGSREALYRLGLIHHAGRGNVRRDDELASKYLERAAIAGHSPAAFLLAAMLEAGLGVHADLEAAFVWTRRAAESGHLDALAYLGSMYMEGKGTALDAEKGFIVLREAAIRGHSGAMVQVARAFAEEVGTTPSDEEALYWFTRAADAGDASAIAMLARAYSEGLFGAAQDLQKAADYDAKLAQRVTPL